jgi:15-cis-phytoene desaturase
MDPKPKVIIIGSGLRPWVLGFYKEFPELVKKAGLKMKDVVIWEDEIEIKLATGANGPSYVYGASPVFKPFKTFSSPFRNHLIPWSETRKVLKFLVSGISDWLAKPEKLDEISVLAYANRFHLNEETIRGLIVPLTPVYFSFRPPSTVPTFFSGLLFMR